MECALALSGTIFSCRIKLTKGDKTKLTVYVGLDYSMEPSEIDLGECMA